ncbi:3-oxoadipate enol-lactonase [Yoonia sp. 2307UL14-13]|uniref:3-oxoadipate enol-lactonase n=1 Tax=Yoonia sp. 2307UL14-13 TaxID=3126506 RepID=UPI0030AFC842
MQIIRGNIRLHVQVDGPDDGVPVVFANSLGTNLHVWDEVLRYLPDGLRIVRYDMRGHGKSSVPSGPYTMGQLISDAETICDALDVRDALFVGLSVGGMVAQGLAVKRPEIIRAMVLSNTAAKIGHPKLWLDRIAAVERLGLDGVADEVMQRWFSPSFVHVAPWREMLVATSVEGYVGTCAAISGTDFYTSTSRLRIPTLGIAGSEDGATPPDLVRETVDLVPGSQFVLMRGVGHLPCVEDPDGYARHLTQFMRDTGHL